MAEFIEDFQRLVFWHPESDVVIDAESMPKELMPDVLVYGELPVELQLNQRLARFDAFVKDLWGDTIKQQLKETRRLQEELKRFVSPGSKFDPNKVVNFYAPKIVNPE